MAPQITPKSASAPKSRPEAPWSPLGRILDPFWPHVGPPGATGQEVFRDRCGPEAHKDAGSVAVLGAPAPLDPATEPSRLTLAVAERVSEGAQIPLTLQLLQDPCHAQHSNTRGPQELMEEPPP